MEIVEHKKAPESIIIASQDCYKETPVEKIIFAADIKLNNKMAIYNPNKQTVTIDLLECCRNAQWSNIGMLLIPNTYCNILYCVFHEAAHARQWSLNPDSFKFNNIEIDQTEAI